MLVRCSFPRPAIAAVTRTRCRQWEYFASIGGRILCRVKAAVEGSALEGSSSLLQVQFLFLLSLALKSPRNLQGKVRRPESPTSHPSSERTTASDAGLARPFYTAPALMGLFAPSSTSPPPHLTSPHLPGEAGRMAEQSYLSLSLSTVLVRTFSCKGPWEGGGGSWVMYQEGLHLTPDQKGKQRDGQQIVQVFGS